MIVAPIAAGFLFPDRDRQQPRRTARALLTGRQAIQLGLHVSRPANLHFHLSPLVGDFNGLKIDELLMVCELRAEGFQADHGSLDFCFAEQRGRTAQEDSIRVVRQSHSMLYRTAQS